jgi:hypothetical protein
MEVIALLLVLAIPIGIPIAFAILCERDRMANSPKSPEEPREIFLPPTSFRKDIGEPIYFLGERITEEIELFEWATRELDNWGYSLIDHMSRSSSAIFKRNHTMHMSRHWFLEFKDIPFGFNWFIQRDNSRYNDGAEYTCNGLTADEAEYLYTKFEELKSVEGNFAMARSRRTHRLKINKSYGLEDPDGAW